MLRSFTELAVRNPPLRLAILSAGRGRTGQEHRPGGRPCLGLSRGPEFCLRHGDDLQRPLQRKFTLCMKVMVMAWDGSFQNLQLCEWAAINLPCFNGHFKEWLSAIPFEILCK